MKDITCETALDRLLEAAPAELRGRADTELAAHIAGCHRCAAVAAAMLEELGAVDHALADYATHPTADAAADAALAAIRKEDGDGVVSLEGRRWLRTAWVPLAAAAALAAVLVFGQDDPFSGPGVGTTSPPEPTLEPRVAVTPPADKGAAIMETENPNITIVWLYEREGT